MWPKNSTAEHGQGWRLRCVLLLTLLAGSRATSAAPGPDRRGLPLEVEAGGKLPATLPAPAGPTAPEREGIEALDLDLGPIPRRVVLGEESSAATWKQAAAIPEATLVLSLPRGNMIRPALRRRLASMPKVELLLELPLLPVHREQLIRIPSLVGLVLGVDPGEDEAARRAITRLPPTRVRVLLRGPVDASRIARWETLRRVGLILPLLDAEVSPELLSALAPLRARLEVQLMAGRVAATRETLEKIGAGAVTLIVRSGLPPRAELLGLGRVGRALRLRFEGAPRVADLKALRGLPGLELELWLSGLRRRRAREALSMMLRTLGHRKPR